MKKTSKELPASSTSSYSETCSNLQNPPYPDNANVKTTAMDDSMKQAILSSKYGDEHLFIFSSS